MSLRGKGRALIGSFGAFLLLLVAPLLWPGSAQRGYFYRGRCLCGHDMFVRIEGDSLLDYSPGHGVPERAAFKLRRHQKGWDILGPPHSDLYWSPLEGEDRVIGHLRMEEGALCESLGSTNWERFPRVYNVWRVWIPKLLKQ